MKELKDKIDSIINEGMLGDMAHKCEADHEVQMARADLYKIAKYAIKLHEMMKNISEAEGLQGWQQSKIAKAADYLGSVYHNMDYEMSPLNTMNDDMVYDLATEDKPRSPDYTPNPKNNPAFADAQKLSDKEVRDQLKSQKMGATPRPKTMGKQGPTFGDWGKK